MEIEDFKDLSEGDDIGVCGFPLGNFLYEQLGTVTSSFTKGILSSIIPASNVMLEHLGGFQLNVTATHGNSGGPVYFIDSMRAYGGATNVGVIQFIIGLVSQEHLVKEEIRELYGKREQQYPLALGEVIHASFIKETIDLLPVPTTPT